jgi:trehalose-phosphatase
MAQTRKPTTYQRGAALKACKRMPRVARRGRSRHLLERWPQVEKRLRAAKRVALFLDFDGTLVPLCRRPEDVRLDSTTRRLLQRLARHPRLTVVVISGRQRRDTMRRIKVGGLQYLGLYGLERGDPVPPASPAYAVLRRARRLLAARMSGLPDLWIEDKRLSFAVHYRGATADTVQQARHILRETLKPLESVLRVQPSKKAWEVLLREAPGKGAAVADILKELPAGTLPIYVGDDTTDESAFAVLAKGVTVRVGALRHSKARYKLRSPAEVLNFLERLEVDIS